MVKKVKSKRTASAAAAKAAPAANSLRHSAQQIWLNGLGAFAKAQESGNKVFETLVEEGRSLKQRTRSLAEDKVGLVTARATTTWDKLEGAFETRVAQVLQGLGVPSRHDIEALSDRVAQLSEAVEALGGKPARKAKPAKASAKATAQVATKAAPRRSAAQAAKAAPAKAARKPAAKASSSAPVKAVSTSRRAAAAVKTSAGEAAAA